MEDLLRYSVKRPSGKRKTFGLVCFLPIDRKTKKYQPLKPELQTQVNQINAQFIAKTIDERQAYTLIKDLIAREYRRLEVRDRVLKDSVLSVVNQKVFNNFWNKVYEAKELVDAGSANYDFQKAIKLIEPLSLVTATAQEFKARLRKTCKGPLEMRRAIDRLNQLLKFLSRDVRLDKPEEPFRTIRHLTQPELNKVLGHLVVPTLKDLVIALFATGLRLSEAMAVTETDYHDGTLNVDKQLTRHKVHKRPKRGKQGRVFVIPKGVPALKRWLAVENKPNHRYAVSEALLEACKKAFPNDRKKWISPHDLRHSHAIYLLGQGASLTQVALNLRNRIEVCQKYYTGFAHTGDTIEALKRTVG